MKSSENKCVLNFLIENKIEFDASKDLRKLSWLKQDGTIDFVIYPSTLQELQRITAFLAFNHISYKVLGNTSNCLFLDRHYGVFVILKYFNEVTVDLASGTLTAGAGAQLSKVCKIAAEQGLSGFEGMIGIPATIGGAVFMNAGSYGCAISHIFKSATILSPEGNLFEVNHGQMGFDTRSTSLNRHQIDGIIINATFSLCADHKCNILERMNHAKKHRLCMQENKEPNLGSMFVATRFYQTILDANPVVKWTTFPIRLPIALVNRLWRRMFKYKISPGDILLLHFYRTLFRYPLPYRVHSSISLNCFVKRKDSMDERQDFIRYFNWLNSVSKAKLDLENEIVVSDYHKNEQ